MGWPCAEVISLLSLSTPSLSLALKIMINIILREHTQTNWYLNQTTTGKLITPRDVLRSLVKRRTCWRRSKTLQEGLLLILDVNDERAPCAALCGLITKYSEWRALLTMRSCLYLAHWAKIEIQRERVYLGDKIKYLLFHKWYWIFKRCFNCCSQLTLPLSILMEMTYVFNNLKVAAVNSMTFLKMHNFNSGYLFSVF